tara:strand:+ start:192 stop:581 length:390 start_codon:yes stop_codon:yes gene_type:complete
MKVKDLDKVVAIEKAIAKKFGTETIANPKAFWTDEKEEEYLEQVKEFYKEEKKKEEQADKVEKDGFFLPKNLITKKSKRKCPVCDIYSFEIRDDLYMNKFECCFKCFIQYVDGREERWEKGWRPDKEQD